MPPENVSKGVELHVYYDGLDFAITDVSPMPDLTMGANNFKSIYVPFEEDDSDVFEFHMKIDCKLRKWAIRLFRHMGIDLLALRFPKKKRRRDKRLKRRMI